MVESRKPKPTTARAMDRAHGFTIGRESGELVRDDALRPAIPLRKPKDLGRVWLSWPGQDGHFSEKDTAGFALHSHRVGTLGPLGGNHDPFLGHEILAEFRHSEPPSLSVLPFPLSCAPKLSLTVSLVPNSVPPRATWLKREPCGTYILLYSEHSSMKLQNAAQWL